MSQAQLLSLIGVLFALFCGVVAFVLRYILAHHTAVLQSRVDALAADYAKLEGRFEQRTRDKDKFDYEWRHGSYVNDINSINLRLLPLGQKVADLDERMDSLHRWKHEVGDAYLPRAVDDHHRRLERLEARVFNGHGNER